tara:strand:+ start:676 stop:1593 length:918 start_codon:yes stop_codon:yes gene_type:complete
MIELLVVNYHYIREEIPKSGIYPITPAFFTKQIDKIASNGYKFITLQDVILAVQDIIILPSKSCLITFDDGLRESYEVGLPVLNRKGIQAAFFVISDTLKSKELIDVHKLHILRSRVNDQDILEKIKDQVNFDDLDTDAVLDQYPFDNLLAAEVKYMLNFKRKDLIDPVFNSFCGDEAKLAEELYLTRQQATALGYQKCLGTHSTNHCPLSMLNDEELEANVRGSMEDIEEYLGARVNAISYPYGESTAVDNRVEKICKDLGLIVGFSMFRKVNTDNDILCHPLMINRFDTNDIFGGKNYGKYKL